MRVLHESITAERIIDAVERRDTPGFCIICGYEPDARNYVCESCDRHEVYAPEEIIQEGWV